MFSSGTVRPSDPYGSRNYDTTSIVCTSSVRKLLQEVHDVSRRNFVLFGTEFWTHMLSQSLDRLAPGTTLPQVQHLTHLYPNRKLHYPGGIPSTGAEIRHLFSWLNAISYSDPLLKRAFFLVKSWSGAAMLAKSEMNLL